MISKLAERAANALLLASEVEEEDIALYTYGFFMLFSYMIYLAITTVFGLTMGILKESYLFFVLFSLLRSYAGGVHAAKEWQCIILTTLSVLLSLIAIKVLANILTVYAAISLGAVSLITILLLSPLDTAEKRLTIEEKKNYKTSSTVYAIFILLVAGIAFYCKRIALSCSCLMALVLESFLLIIGVVQSKVNVKCIK